MEKEARTKETAMTTVPTNAVGRYPNRSATVPDKNPVKYVIPLPVVPTNAIDEAEAPGKTIW